jgi:sugar lactone lactonase YvrE
MNRLPWLGLLLIVVGPVAAQDVTLDQVLLPGEGWHQVKGVSGTPGALAADRAGNIYVADAEKQQITRIDPEGKARLFAKTGAVVRCLTFAGDVLCASLPSKEQIVRYGETGKEEVVRNNIAALDLVVRDSRMYCAERGRLLVLNQKDGRLVAAWKCLSDASALALWNSGGTLVLGEVANRHLYAFRIQKDGSSDAQERYYPLQVRRKGSSRVRGLVLDTKGLLYAATPEGVQVFDRTGRLSGVMERPLRGPVTAIAFGGKERDRLFIACGGKLWQRKTKVKGSP